MCIIFVGAMLQRIRHQTFRIRRRNAMVKRRTDDFDVRSFAAIAHADATLHQYLARFDARLLAQRL